MASNVTPIERLDDRPSGISPAAIEAEFARLWRETAEPGVDDSSIRLRTMNFVAVGPETWTVERFERVMESLPQRHPCRGVLAVTSPDRTKLEASISALCWRTATGGRHVCSEEVVLKAGPNDQFALASSVLALLVTELPLNVWVVGPIDLDAHLESELIDSAEILFVDTADATDITATLQSVLSARRKHDVAVCDLAWRRLAGWRALVAQFFDGQAGVERLSDLQSIEITGGAGISSEMLLIAGWFISCLGLSLAEAERDDDSISATLYDRSRGVTIKLSASGESPAHVTEIKVRASGGEFLVQAHAASAHMHVREEWPDRSDHRTVDQVAIDDASVFADALDDVSDLPVFLDAARGALSLLLASSQLS